jgi:hypothetical protein
LQNPNIYSSLSLFLDGLYFVIYTESSRNVKDFSTKCPKEREREKRRKTRDYISGKEASQAG